MNTPAHLAPDLSITRWKQSVSADLTTLGFDAWVEYMKAHPEEPESCEGCDPTTPGIRPNANGNRGHAGPPPAGFVIVERCDLCQVYPDDLAAAAAYGAEAQWQSGRGTEQAICQPPAAAVQSQA